MGGTHRRVSDEFRDSRVVITEYIRYLFLSLDPTNIMPGRRSVATKRAAQREWMIEQKRKAAKTEEVEAQEEEVEDKVTEESKESDNDSGVEDTVDTTEEVTPQETTEEEDGPLEDWTKKELVDECKALGLSDKENKAALIERIKKKKAKKEAVPAEETPAVEETPAAEEVPANEETLAAEETPAVEEAPATEEAPAVEEAKETPAAEETPAVEEAQATDEAP